MIVDASMATLLDQGGRRITRLDGNRVRKHLSKGLSPFNGAQRVRSEG